MENTHFFNPFKFGIKNNCNCFDEVKQEIKTEETNIENAKQDKVLKLDFHLFDIDQVFEN